MPGEFYIENKQEKETIGDISSEVENIEAKLDKLAGEPAGQGSVTADWQSAEAEVIAIGATDTRYKIHDLTLGIDNLAGTQITVRLYKPVNGAERCIYRQDFNAVTDTPALPVINGTWAIHDILRVTLQSNDVADNGQGVDYDFMLEAM